MNRHQRRKAKVTATKLVFKLADLATLETNPTLQKLYVEKADTLNAAIAEDNWDVVNTVYDWARENVNESASHEKK